MAEEPKIWEQNDPEENYERDYYIDFSRKAIIESRLPKDYGLDKVKHLKIGDKKWLSWGRIRKTKRRRLYEIVEITGKEIVFDLQFLEERVEEIPQAQSTLLSIIVELIGDACAQGVISPTPLDSWKVEPNEDQAFTNWLTKIASTLNPCAKKSDHYNILQNKYIVLLTTLAREAESVVQVAGREIKEQKKQQDKPQ